MLHARLQRVHVDDQHSTGWHVCTHAVLLPVCEPS